MFSKYFLRKKILFAVIVLLFLFTIIQYEYRIKKINKEDLGDYFETSKIKKPIYVKKFYPRYTDELLVEWEPAPKIPLNASEPGHLGKPVDIPLSKKKLGKLLSDLFLVNVVASDMISFNRTTADYRHPECLNKTYPKKLPTTTVVIVFSDESWSTLIRTLWSVYSRSPRALLKEIILIDDYSTYPHLGQKLDDYIKQIPVKIRLIRLQQRAGIVVAREIAVGLVTTPTVTFMDAHCECDEGWLEPLLTSVLENRRVAITPMIEFINADNLGVGFVADYYRIYGLFDWTLFFKWAFMPKREIDRNHGDRTANVRTPEFAGGIFSIDREYFYDVGGYDDKMTYYGGENVEMSLRLWMCGGSIETAPCSRVAHVQRGQKPYSIKGGLFYSMVINTVRVVDVWLDEYKKLFYGTHPEYIARRSNVSDRMELRRQLQCKPFKWYIENIFPESIYARKYIDIGSIESMSKVEFCTLNYGNSKQEVSVSKCQRGAAENNKAFMLTVQGEILSDSLCLTAAGVDKPLKFLSCERHYKDNAKNTQIFVYEKESSLFKYNGTDCMTLNSDDKVILKPCNATLVQKWKINSFVPPDSIF